jgi:hypothetical protein
MECEAALLGFRGNGLEARALAASLRVHRPAYVIRTRAIFMPTPAAKDFANAAIAASRAQARSRASVCGRRRGGRTSASHVTVHPPARR